MVRRTLSILLITSLVFILRSFYKMLIAQVSGYPSLSREDRGRIAQVTSLEDVDLNDYNAFIKEDELFRHSLYIQKLEPKEYRHISVFSTLEYIGNNDSITIWSGRPYYGYSIVDSNSVYYVMTTILTELTSTVIAKGEVIVLPFINGRGYSNNDPKALYWEMAGKDEYLRLPIGKYKLTTGLYFSLSMDSDEYDNEITIDIHVTK